MNNKVLKNPILRKTVFAALLAALVCAATMVITIPSPLGGFLNLGDGFVLLSGWLLGPLYGFAAGGIGSALADLFLGYPVYIPGTFVIKGLSALLASVLCAAFCRMMKNKTLPPLLASLVAEAEMVAGYFAYAAIVRGKGLAAAASIPGNLAQGAAGIIVFMLCFVLFEKYHLKDRLLRRYSGDT